MKENLLENNRRWRKTKKGLITDLFHKLKGRNVVEFDLQWLHDFANCQKFNRLYDEWVKSGHKKEFKPSIDRISNKKGYLINNVQWLTWTENRYKQSMERRCRKGRVIQKQGNKIINIYRSQREAVMKTGINQGNMGGALNGRHKTAGGYSWEYENSEMSKIKTGR